MKSKNHEFTRELVKELSTACEVELPPADLQDRELMTWDEIRNAARCCITVGSHTHTHRVLSTIDLDAQKEEMDISRTILEREVANPVRSIAYPVGGNQHFTEQTQCTAADCGYELGFAFGDINRGRSLSRYRINRVAAPDQYSLVPAISVFPRLFTWKRQ